jgi:hypothetical protein
MAVKNAFAGKATYTPQPIFLGARLLFLPLAECYSLEDAEAESLGLGEIRPCIPFRSVLPAPSSSVSNSCVVSLLSLQTLASSL